MNEPGRRWRRVKNGLGAAILALACGGCWSSTGPEVVVYTALDAEFSQPVLDDFQRETGIRVLAKFDVESTKTVGLANAIIAESKRPRADVFWNNEVLHTLRLESRGLLEAWRPPAAASYPAQFRSPEGRWHGFAARARVLLVNTRLVGEGERPRTVGELAEPRWRGRAGLAKPLFGTTATHAACLFAVWGPQQAERFFRSVKDNAAGVLAGNKRVAEAVAAGQLAWGVTDTDDAIVEVDRGSPVAIVYPDQDEGGLGTLFIPNTLAIVKGCPRPAEARRLVDYLLSPEVEAKLAAGPSAQIPLNRSAGGQARVATPATVRAMQVDFRAAAEQWDVAAQRMKELFAGSE